MAKRSPKRLPGFVFRSGYIVPFEADRRATLDHLQKAIIGESMDQAHGPKNPNKNKALAKEIVAVASHLARSLPTDLAIALLADIDVTGLFCSSRNERPRVQEGTGKMPKRTFTGVRASDAGPGDRDRKRAGDRVRRLAAPPNGLR